MKLARLAPAGPLLLLLSSCGGSEGPVLSRLFSGPVWPGGERLVYQVRERDEIRGSCLLQVEDAGEAGRIRLVSLCASPDGLHRDDRRVEVEEMTLTPIRSERVIANLEEQSETIFSASYGDGEVALAADSNGKRNETRRELPRPSKESPEPGYYDDASLFWLIRGAPLAAGYESAFVDVNPGNGRLFTVHLVVTGSETVTVPAGQFEAWRVEVRTGSITQIVWVEQSSPKRIVLARIEREFHELLPDSNPWRRSFGRCAIGIFDGGAQVLADERKSFQTSLTSDFSRPQDAERLSASPAQGF